MRKPTHSRPAKRQRLMTQSEARTETLLLLSGSLQAYHIKLFPVQGQKAFPTAKIKIIAQDCSPKAFCPNLSDGLSHHWELLCHLLTGQQREKGAHRYRGLRLKGERRTNNN